MGHAVYTKSDPRCQIFKGYVGKLAEEKGRKRDYDLYNLVERLAPQVIGKNRRIYKGVSANVDFYSGLIYSMLDIPEELFTPMFAIARIVGWSAHRLEELINVDKIIRPAYISISEPADYLPMDARESFVGTFLFGKKGCRRSVSLRYLFQCIQFDHHVRKEGMRAL